MITRRTFLAGMVLAIAFVLHPLRTGNEPPRRPRPTKPPKPSATPTPTPPPPVSVAQATALPLTLPR